MTQDTDSTLSAAQRHFDAGRLDEAARLLQDILAIAPGHGEALEGLGYIAARRGDHAAAAAHLAHAARQGNMSAGQLLSAAQVCQAAGRHDEAAGLFRQCLALAPHQAAALYGAAMSLASLGDRDAALELLDRLCRQNPQSPEAHYNRGALLGAMARHDEEIAAYQRAIALKPDFTAAYTNLGVALRDLHRFDEALRQFKKALSLDPDDAGARTNRAQTNLLLGQFEHGWRDYEWRWRDGHQRHGFAEAARWTGTQPLQGKTLFVHHEQGYGDTLQFLRFASRAAERGARVVVRVQDALLPLLRGWPGADEIIGEDAPVPAFDYHIPLLSLPYALGAREADLALPVPHLAADPALAAQWRARLPDTRRPRIGIAWSGSRTHLNDAHRSIPLPALQALFDLPADFVSLQHDVRERDAACRAALTERGVLHDAPGRFASFADTAALVDALDLVVSVDTAVAHLAATLGRPTWILLPHTPDWRWQLGRDDSPWYPNVRLFRQAARGDWRAALDALRDALAGWLARQPPR